MMYVLNVWGYGQCLLISEQMKKRRQPPDAHTYTILLRGLAWNSGYGKSLERALSVYHSMFAPNSPVKPTVIHTNATLKVCARAGDLDALWGVAARLPTSGPRAPDKATFTTIFNAVHRIISEVSRDSEEQSLKEKVDRRQQAVMQGRRMWAEIIDRWKAGDIGLDEELICAVGRLLLLADVPQDLDDIMSLAEQTMGIRRQTPRRQDHPANSAAFQPSQRSEESFVQKKPDNERRSMDGESTITAKDDGFVPGDEFLPIPSMDPKSFSRPSHNTLSLLLDACTRLKLVPVAQDYWGLLTSHPYNIIPDTENYHMYLRLLRVQRASKQCIELIQEMQAGLGTGPSVPKPDRKGIQGEAGGVQAKTFRIALGACKRDINNPNVLANASKLVRMMIDTLPEVDVRVLYMYVEVCTGVAAHDWRALSAALRGTELGVRQLRSLLHFDREGVPLGSETVKDVERYKEIYDFLNLLIGAYDKLLARDGEQMLPQERYRAAVQKGMIGSWQAMPRRRLGIVQGSRHHWGKWKREEGKMPEMGGARNEKKWSRELRLGERTLVQSEQGEEQGRREENEDTGPPALREARMTLRSHQNYAWGGANKRRAMAEYLRKVENASLA